jgi:hypothetical protein
MRGQSGIILGRKSLPIDEITLRSFYRSSPAVAVRYLVIEDKEVKNSRKS